MIPAPNGKSWKRFDGFEKSLEANGPDRAKPDILVYRRFDARVPQNDPEDEKRAAEQERKADQFFSSYFENSDGANSRAFSPYQGLTQFEENLTNHLNDLIVSKIPKLEANQGTPPPINGNPYLGLYHFDFHHSDRFFGRNKAIREVLSLLKRQDLAGHPFVLIYGASGYGKSSLMRAGVAPRLTAPGFLDDHPDPITQWRRVLISPSLANGNPIEALAHALLSPEDPHPDTPENAPLIGLPELTQITPHSQTNEKENYHSASLSRLLANQNSLPFVTADLIECLDQLPDTDSAEHRPGLLLQIDQFEELFTHPNATDENTYAFLQLLAHLSLTRRVWIVATMRSEYFPLLAEYSDFLPLIKNGGGYILEPPSDKELLEIIRYPALAGCMTFERHPEESNRDLSDDIYDAAVKQPDALPLLEFTLNELYLAQDIESGDRVFNYDEYEQIGRLENAIATRAEDTFETLPPHQQDAHHQIFAQLLTVQASGEGLATKARADLNSLNASHPGAPAFLEAFQKENLLITDYDPQSKQTTITLAHEALLTNWPLFKDWIDEHRIQLQAETRLQEQTQRWITNKQIYGSNAAKSYLLTEANLAEARRVETSPLFILDTETTTYLQASEKKATRKRRLVKLTVLILALLAAGAGFFGYQSAQNEKKSYQSGRENSRRSN